ncbi:alpha-ketoglutarate-dependent dioxygenase AlkB [Candidatus Uabimicrobium amorphum]|uniref:Alkylated DNA repair protein n=1 Tax=Uabimicrobium amorphum TaxID=2596890 RepID=A0A5S9F5D1_UABAM|nr:alpha-ketoglutarate-dependent dioxygenase AlkB [Candidatus Uabimicrobium amorphum]BBM85539.1 alkylated DNA repair protein [Candidatus Uabimicrobium amorphum]
MFEKKIFTHTLLDKDYLLWEAMLPKDLQFDTDKFQKLWQMHPQNYHEIKMHGRVVKTPRWQQAYGKNYKYTGSVNNALPIPPLLQDIMSWCQKTIDHRLNSMLLNWYDAKLGHYIGKHRDSTHDMIPNTPIVTVSFGEERVFRLRPWKQKGYRDFLAKNNGIFIIPYNTNENWTHEIPKSSKYSQKRISVTLRAFHTTAKGVTDDG